MMNKSQIFWDKHAKEFESNEKQFEHASREIIARTKEYLNANDNVLDFGCATGTKTLELADLVKHIHGLDYSAGMISEAIIRKNKVDVKNVSFSQGTIFDDDLEKASFDKISAFAIIHLMEDCDKVIQRIYTLLKPGGLFISTTAYLKDRMDFRTRLNFTKIRFMWLLGLFPLHLNMFRTSDIERLINKQNFKIVNAEKVFFNEMTIYFIVAEKR